MRKNIFSKKVTILTGALLILIIGGIGLIRHKTEVEEIGSPITESSVKIVDLYQQLNSEIVIFETERVIMKFNLNDVEEILKSRNVSSDQELVVLIREQMRDGSEVKLNDLPDRLLSRIEFCVADLLEKGKGVLFDKDNSAYLDKIKIETYSLYCGPLCGFGGRRYILPDGTEIFFTQDWVS